MNSRQETNWKKYEYTFIITVAIFATAIFISNYFGQKKLDEVRSIQDNISIDILSSETQFSLLEESSCQDIGGTSALSQQLGSLEDKLAATEKDRGANDPTVLTLKKYYSLLEIKDYILLKKISQECKTTPVSIIYFYSNAGDCADCEREGYVLTRLRSEYPTLRVYSFDFNLDLSAVKTLLAINDITGTGTSTLPAIYVAGTQSVPATRTTPYIPATFAHTYYGFQSVDILEATPQLTTLRALQNASTTSATK